MANPKHHTRWQACAVYTSVYLTVANKLVDIASSQWWLTSNRLTFFFNPADHHVTCIVTASLQTTWRISKWGTNIISCAFKDGPKKLLLVFNNNCSNKSVSTTNQYHNWWRASVNVHLKHQIGKKYSCLCWVTVSSVTIDLLGFSHATVSGVHKNWCEKHHHFTVLWAETPC